MQYRSTHMATDFTEYDLETVKTPESVWLRCSPSKGNRQESTPLPPQPEQGYMDVV